MYKRQGYADEIRETLSSKGYEEDIFTIVDIREEIYKKKLIDRYVALPHTLLKEKALNRRMQDPLYYAMEMCIRDSHGLLPEQRTHCRRERGGGAGWV